MLQIECPYCGTRPELEFRCGGEAHIARPEDPSALDDRAWAEFLFYRGNAKGGTAERWNHIHGCQRWFNGLRDTVSDRILKTYKIGDPRPEIQNGANPGANPDAQRRTPRP